jgi:hypothetical protein
MALDFVLVLKYQRHHDVANQNVSQRLLASVAGKESEHHHAAQWREHAGEQHRPPRPAEVGQLNQEEVP